MRTSISNGRSHRTGVQQYSVLPPVIGSSLHQSYILVNASFWWEECCGKGTESCADVDYGPACCQDVRRSVRKIQNHMLPPYHIGLREGAQWCPTLLVQVIVHCAYLWKTWARPRHRKPNYLCSIGHFDGMASRSMMDHDSPHNSEWYQLVSAWKIWPEVGE